MLVNTFFFFRSTSSKGEVEDFVTIVSVPYVSYSFNKLLCSFGSHGSAVYIAESVLTLFVPGLMLRNKAR